MATVTQLSSAAAQVPAAQIDITDTPTRFNGQLRYVMSPRTTTSCVVVRQDGVRSPTQQMSGTDDDGGWSCHHYCWRRDGSDNAIIISTTHACICCHSVTWLEHLLRRMFHACTEDNKKSRHIHIQSCLSTSSSQIELYQRQAHAVAQTFKHCITSLA